MMVRKSLLSLLFTAVIALSCLAQPSGGGPPGDPPPPDVPISGIEILIALGSLFGVKRLMSSKKE